MLQARKKSTKINFLGPETARWGGGLPHEGVVAEKFVPSLESLSFLGFEKRNLECPGDFGGKSGTPGGLQKVCAKKVCAHFCFLYFQRRRDDNKNKIFAFEGGGPWGQRGKSCKNACFRGKRHDNKILKVQILLSRHFVVIAQAPILSRAPISYSFVSRIGAAKVSTAAGSGFAGSLPESIGAVPGLISFVLPASSLKAR